MSSPSPPVSADIPPSTSTVSVKALCPARIRGLPSRLFFGPDIAGTVFADAPCFAFLIEHNSTKTKTDRLIFDNAIRTDWRDKVPAAAELSKQTGASIIADHDVRSILEDHSINTLDIDALVLSHHHLDHIGDPTRLPARKVVVGPGFINAYGPGVESDVPEGSFDGKDLIEIDFTTANLQIGGLSAYDYFGDGSFFLIDTPGHAVGHMSGLARVNIDSDGQSSFVFLGGDACHHAGELRPSASVKLPDTRAELAGMCPNLIRKVHPRASDSEPFFRPTAGIHTDVDKTTETIDTLGPFDADPNIFVILAHDASLETVMDLMPESVDQWKSKGWKNVSRWIFLKEFEVPVEQ